MFSFVRPHDILFAHFFQQQEENNHAHLSKKFCCYTSYELQSVKLFSDAYVYLHILTCDLNALYDKFSGLPSFTVFRN